MIRKLKMFPVMERWPFVEQYQPDLRQPRPTAEVEELRVQLQRHSFSTRLQLTGVLVRRVLGVATPQEVYIASIRFMGWNYYEQYFPTQIVEPSK